MKALLLVAFFSWNGETVEPAGNTSMEYNTMDECLFDAFTSQQFNTQEFFATISCVPIMDGSQAPQGIE